MRIFRAAFFVLLAMLVLPVNLALAEVWWVVCEHKINYHNTNDEKTAVCTQCIGPIQMATVPDSCKYFASQDAAKNYADKHCDCPKKPIPPIPEKKPPMRYE
jgi:hypothetical protein